MTKRILLIFCIISLSASNDIQAMSSRISKIIGYVSRITTGATELHLTAVNGNVKKANQLIENNADVNQPDYINKTPLHYAAMFGNSATATTLLNHSADPNQRDNNGKTPLHMALENEFLSKLLLRHMSDLQNLDPQQILSEGGWWLIDKNSYADKLKEWIQQEIKSRQEEYEILSGY